MKRPKKLTMPPRWLAVDCETTGLYTHLGHRPFLVTAVLHEKGLKDKSFLWEAEVSENGKRRTWPVELWNMLADKALPKVFHNARFDLAMLRASTFKVEGQFHDTAMTGRLHGPHKEVHLKYLARKLLHVSTAHEAALKAWLKEEKARRQKAERELAKKEERKPVKVPSPLYSEVPREILLPYAGDDTRFTSGLFELTAPKVLARCSVAYEIDRRLIRCVTDMQLRGHRLDTTYFRNLIPVCEKAHERVRQELVGKWHLPGSFNANSPQQVKWFLTGVLGIPTREVRNRRDEESTGKEVLFRLWKKYQMTSIRELFECRANLKAVSSFCKPLLELSDAEGIIHPQFWLGYTKTGRLCVAGDTELATSLGVVKIRDLDLTSEVPVRIVTHKGRWRRILRKFYKGCEQMYDVTLENGSKIRCTAGHRFLTSAGWRSLHEIGTLAVQSSKGLTHSASEVVSAASGLLAGTARRRLCSAILEGEATGQGRTEALPLQHQLAGVLSSLLPQEVRETASRASLSALQRKHDEQFPRTERPSSSLAVLQQTQESLVERARLRKDCCELGRQRVYSNEERGVPRIAKGSSAGSAAVAGAASSSCSARLSFASAARTAFARIAGFFGALLRKASSLLSSPLPSVCHASAVLVGCAEAGESSQLLCGEEASSERPRGVELQPGRDAAIRSSAVTQDFAPTACSAVGRQRGFSASEETSRGRGERLDSQCSCGQTPGQAEGAGDSSGGLSATGARFRRGDCEAHGSSEEGSLFSWSRVQKVAPVGAEDVWDIEIEEDHSYIAQGFVNHNSSSDPNLQNIWKDKDRLGFPLPKHLSIRKGFIPRPGFKLYYWDFSQIEAKMFAYWAREKAMMQAFEDGIDIHEATATMMGCTRDVAKTLNYLIIYGGRAGALAGQLGISREEAQVLLDTYYEKFPGVIETMERAEEEVVTKGYATDIYGRRYYVPAEKAYKIVNYIIQGGAGNVLKCAMFHVWKLLLGRKSQMLLTIHDEIVCEIHESEEAELVPQITAIMEDQPYVERYLKTRIGVDVKLSETNWSEKHELKEAA